jgi:hypothetical protein
LPNGAFRERALNVVEAIADSVRAGWSASGDPGTVGGPSLAEGAAGLAVLFAYRADARSGAEDEAAAGRWLEQAINAVSDQPMKPSRYGGLAGVGWAAAHMRKLL